MKTKYLALLAFISFVSHLIYKPNLFTALCVGFSAALICCYELLEFKQREKITQEHLDRIEAIETELKTKIDNIQSEMTSVKISSGFKRQR